MVYKYITSGIKILGLLLRLSKRATKQLQKHRLSICRSCQHYGLVELFNGTEPKCFHCNCYLRAKTRLRNEHCPLGKW